MLHAADKASTDRMSIFSELVYI